MLAATATAQEIVVPQAAALQGQLAQFHNSVSRAMSLAELGSLLCKYDPAAGSSILRTGIDELNLIPANAFTDNTVLLPIPSFSGLARLVVTYAAKCDSSLGLRLASDRVRARIIEERNTVDSLISEAKGIVTDKPDRAAQLLSAAISAAEPGFIDFPKLVRRISELRDRAPELADDVFLEALEFASKQSTPILSYINELGKYLFTAENLLERPDRDQESREFSVGSSSIADFAEPRRSTNPDIISSYLQTITDVSRNQLAWSTDPVTAYSLVYQMGAIARRFAPDASEPLQQAEFQVAAVAGAQAAEVKQQLGSRSNPMNDEDLDGPRRRDRRIQRFQEAWHSGNLDRARNIIPGIDDITVRGQLTQMVRWKEAIQSLERKDFHMAMSAANAFPTGVKRSLLYTSIASRAGKVALSQDALMLAWRDLEGQIAERREYAQLAIAETMFEVGMESGYSVLSQAITAHNEALVRPRRERFDPASVRKYFVIGRDPAFEAALLVRYAKPLYEVVDSGRSRFSFQLALPGVRPASLNSVILLLKDVDSNRIEAIIQELRDEARLGPALVVVAQRRLAAVKQHQ